MKTIKSCTTSITMTPVELAQKLGINEKIVNVSYYTYHDDTDIVITLEAVTDDE